jgi:hypothetical protein
VTEHFGAAIDPGIDLAAAAIYDLHKCRRATGRTDAGWGGIAYGYTAMETVRPDGDDAERCDQLYEWARLVIRARRVGVVALEVPHTLGVYRGKQERQKTKGALNIGGIVKLNQAIAVIRLAARRAGARVIEVPAKYPRYVADKRARHEVLNQLMRRAGKPALAGNADQRDAAFLGLYAFAMELNP